MIGPKEAALAAVDFALGWEGAGEPREHAFAAYLLHHPQAATLVRGLSEELGYTY